MDETMRKTIEAFRRVQERDELPPSVRSLAAELGITSSPAHARLQALERAGYARRRSGTGDRIYVLTEKAGTRRG